MGEAKKVLQTSVIAGAVSVAAGAWALAPRLPLVRKWRGLSIPLVAFAHRGLHDAGSGITQTPSSEELKYRQLVQQKVVEAGYLLPEDIDEGSPYAPENSLAAFAAAAQAGYGIELDIQLTADGEVVVIHDATLSRVAGDNRAIADLDYDELARVPLFGSPMDKKTGLPVHHVPLLQEVLDVVSGRSPLIIEYKMGESLNKDLMVAANAILADYKGWYCMESFNPLAVAWYRWNAPQILRGQLAAPPNMGLRQVSSAKDFVKWSAGRLLLNWVGRPDFVAYEWHGGKQYTFKISRHLGAVPVAWTVRSALAQLESFGNFNRIIFESFIPASL